MILEHAAKKRHRKHDAKGWVGCNSWTMGWVVGKNPSKMGFEERKRIGSRDVVMLRGTVDVTAKKRTTAYACVAPAVLMMPSMRSESSGPRAVTSSTVVTICG